MNALRVYYSIKPLIPRRMQLLTRRVVASVQRRAAKAFWPIDHRASVAPLGWAGWPEGKRFALILYHDVDTAHGLKSCLRLMELEKRLGFRSSFFFVPGDYHVPPGLRETLVREGFEVGIHGFKHDGQALLNRKIFQGWTQRINHILKDWGAVGYSSPSTLKQLDWIAELDIEYDCSSFDTDPFEPSPIGAGTIFPFPFGGPSGQANIIEIPYTLPQDHTLFVILKERSINIWKEKLDWIAEQGGAAVLNTHPDYMNFDGARNSYNSYPAQNYIDFLEYVKAKHPGCYWHALPRSMADFWRSFLQSSQNLAGDGVQVPESQPSGPLDTTLSEMDRPLALEAKQTP